MVYFTPELLVYFTPESWYTLEWNTQSGIGNDRPCVGTEFALHGTGRRYVGPKWGADHGLDERALYYVLDLNGDEMVYPVGAPKSRSGASRQQETGTNKSKNGQNPLQAEHLQGYSAGLALEKSKNQEKGQGQAQVYGKNLQGMVL